MISPHRNASIDTPACKAMSALGQLNGELNNAMAEPAPLTVAAFGDFIRRDAGRWAEMVRISGAKAE